VAMSSAESTSQFYELKQLLEQSTVIFEAMATRSRVCFKASPVLRSLLSTFPANTNRGQGGSASQQMNNEDYGLQASEIADRLQPQQWMSPSVFAWGEWDFILTPEEMIS